jgi:iron complex transport system substrate-binding protein
MALNILLNSCKSDKEERSGKVDDRCKRIVSTAPSITETLFELGLGERIVGVSDNCSYRQKLKNIEKVGKVLDLSYESILIKEPDMVIFPAYHSQQAEKIRKLGVQTLTVDHSTIEGFIESMDSISRICEKDKQTEQIRSKYKDIIEKKFSPEVKTDEKIKVMIVVGREYLENGIKDVYIAGKDGFYSEILSLFEGFSNVYDGNIAYPKIQIEGVVTMSPDIIIDIVTNRKMTNKELEKMGDDWKVLEAIKKDSFNSRIFVVNRNYWSIPGPRFIKIIEDMNKIFLSEKGMVLNE